MVRCLGCGKQYVKPGGRGTLSSNPGCPECGYVGWLPSSDPVTRATRDRSGASRRLLRSTRSG
jgi:hypothetical protein